MIPPAARAAAKRVEEIGDSVLLLGDARDLVPLIGTVDAIVTDPPYGCGKAEWDSQYPDWLEPLARRWAHAICIMPGMWALPKCTALMGCDYRSVIAGRNANGMTFGPIGYNNWIPAVVGKNVPRRGQDCFEFSVGAEQKPDHPSPKPLSFMLKLIERVTEPNWIVEDPFCGSGTTGVACLKLGRKFIGVEWEETYFDLSCRRIEAAYKQPDFFVERPAPAIQEPLFDTPHHSRKARA